MSNYHSEEELFGAQLQLALVPVSTSVANFNARDAYWEFLDRALHSGLPDMPISMPITPLTEIRPDDFAPFRQEYRTTHGRFEYFVPTVFSRPFRQPLYIESDESFKPRENLSNRCSMCFDDLASDALSPDVQTQLPRGIACPRSHLICRGCLDNLIVERCTTVLHTPSTPSQIDCPACLAHRALGGFGLDRFSHRRSSVAPSFTDDQLKHACGGASKAALELLESVAQADEKLAALPESEQITHGNTDCYLCPKCKFGPVAHIACGDLSVHHGTQGVSNRCPKCRFLGTSISEWIRIAQPISSAPTLWPTAPRADDEFFGRRMPRNVPFFNGYQEPVRPAFVVPTRLLDLPFYLHVHPSYWDAPMLRLMRSSWQVAEATAASRLAITDGSEQCEVEGQSRAGSWSRANKDVLHLSLAEDSCRCLRVACAANVQTVSQWTRRDHQEASLHPLPQMTPKYLASLDWEARLFIRLFEKALAASVVFINASVAFKSGPEADGMKCQLEMRRDTQLACT